VLTLNTDLLSPNSFTPSSASLTASNIVTTSRTKLSNGSVSFNVTLPAGFTFTNMSALGVLHCLPFITDTTETVIDIAQSTFQSSGNPSCLTTQSTGTTNFTLTPNCSDSIITTTMGHGITFAIQSIIPNPTNGELRIEVSGESRLHYDLFDVLGNSVRNGELTNHHLNIQSLPSGSYYLRLSTPSHSETRRIVRE
jgi:hypothetical protein